MSKSPSRSLLYPSTSARIRSTFFTLPLCVGHIIDFHLSPKREKILHVTNRRYTSILVLLCSVLAGCDDTDEQQQNAAQDIPTSISRTAPQPNPETLDVRPTSLAPVPTQLTTSPRYELYSTYSGQDIHQITGVSGRTLWLCFTAPWCPHSAEMVRELKQLANEEKGHVQVVNVNADAYPDLAEQFHITKVPTTILYTEGVKLRTIEGAYNAASLRRYLQRVLSRDDDAQDSPADALLIPNP